MKLNVLIIALVTWLIGVSGAEVAEMKAKAAVEVNLKEIKHPVSPYLWEVKKEGAKGVSYLFGSLHLGDPRILKLHPAAEAAFVRSNKVFTEVGFSEEETMATLQFMMRTDGVTLSKSVGGELTEKMDRELKAIGGFLNMETFNSFKTWAMAVTYPQLEGQMKNPMFLDLSLYQRAEKEGKALGVLEDVKGLVAIMDTLTEKEQVAILKDTVESMIKLGKEGVDLNEEIMNAYLKADTDALNKFFIYDEKNTQLSEELFNKFIHLLLAERNKVMLATVEGAIKETPEQINFFIAGAAHYVGPDNVVEMLNKKGYTVTRVKQELPINAIER